MFYSPKFQIMDTLRKLTLQLCLPVLGWLLENVKNESLLWMTNMHSECYIPLYQILWLLYDQGRIILSFLIHWFTMSFKWKNCCKFRKLLLTCYPTINPHIIDIKDIVYLELMIWFHSFRFYNPFTPIYMRLGEKKTFLSSCYLSIILLL